MYGNDLLYYEYTFTKDGLDYHVYAPSKTDAIERYLKDKCLSELPKACVITRHNV